MVLIHRLAHLFGVNRRRMVRGAEGDYQWIALLCSRCGAVSYRAWTPLPIGALFGEDRVRVET